MTLTATTNRKQYAGDGSTTAFPTTFVFYDDDDLTVTESVDSTGVETTLVRGTHYTVSGGDGSNGTVTAITTPTDHTPATGETWTISSTLANTQPTDIPVGGSLPSDPLEQQLDQIVRQIQQLETKLGRVPQLKVSSAESEISLDNLDGNTAKFARVNAAEDGFDYATVTSSGTITDPVPIANGGTNATTAGAARTNLAAAGTGLANVFTETQEIVSTDAGAATGPVLNLYRNSASPAVDDNIASVHYYGESSTGVKTIYASVQALIVDPTNGSEDAELGFETMVAGSRARRVEIRNGMYMNGATSQDMGADSFNASDYYKDGEPLQRATTSNIATTSGTTRDITGIPARTSKITIMLDGVSQDTANQQLLLQLGDSGGFETTGYISTSLQVVATAVIARSTAGFLLSEATHYNAATLMYAKIDLVHMGGNIWACISHGNENSASLFWVGNGQKTLSGELTQIRLTTVGGAAAFDLGTMRLVAS